MRLARRLSGRWQTEAASVLLTATANHPPRSTGVMLQLLVPRLRTAGQPRKTQYHLIHRVCWKQSLPLWRGGGRIAPRLSALIPGLGKQGIVDNRHKNTLIRNSHARHSISAAIDNIGPRTSSRPLTASSRRKILATSQSTTK